jgi:hypothetical protein
MTTRIRQLLHTTPAYQNAVLRLMVEEANFLARQLDLNETASAINGYVDSPTNGIGGKVSSENYSFEFRAGKLHSIRKPKWFEKASSASAQFSAPLDASTAHDLARQRLAAVFVDVAELEKKYRCNLFDVVVPRRGSHRDEYNDAAEGLGFPIFLIGWGDSAMQMLLQERFRALQERFNREVRAPMPSPMHSQVFVQLLSTTRELIDLSVNDLALLKRPALELADAGDLLGPTPSPQTFVEELFGGAEAFRTVSSPDEVVAWLLEPNSDKGNYLNKPARQGPRRLSAEAAKAFSDALLDFDSYLWTQTKGCIVDYGARLRFVRGGDEVIVQLCYECDMLDIHHAGQRSRADFDHARDALVRALQAVFPDDGIVRGLKLKGDGSNP